MHTLTSDRRAEAQRIWRGLEAKCGAAGLSCSWDWTDTWLEHFGDVVPHRFIVGEADGSVRGVTLVTEAAHRQPPYIGLRIAHIGTAGEPPGESVCVERNRLLVADADREVFAAGLVAAISSDRRWDRLVLDGMHPEDAEMLQRVAPDLRLEVQESPVADLAAATGGDVLSILPSSRRQRVRRTLRHFGTLHAEWAATLPEAHDILDELIVLHQARWTAAGQPGAFASPRSASFHRALVTRLMPRNGVMLFRVRSSDATVGCLYGLIEEQRLLFYQSGLRRYEDNRLRAGLAVHALCMQACLEHGFREYDFLAPATRYKRELCTRLDLLIWAALERSRPRIWLGRGRRCARRTWRRLGATTDASAGEH